MPYKALDRVGGNVNIENQSKQGERSSRVGGQLLLAQLLFIAGKLLYITLLLDR